MMKYSLSPYTILRPEQQSALFFNRLSAETLELDQAGLEALLDLVLGRSRGSLRFWMFRVYLLQRGFIQTGCVLQDADQVRTCLEQAQSLQTPLRALSVPEALHIAITDRCDQVCSGCFFSNITNKSTSQLMSLELFRKIIDAAAEVKVFQIALGGGEPLSHPQCLAMIRYASQKGLVPNLTTNGNRLRLETALDLKQAGLGQVQLSLNASTPELNRLTRPNYDKLLQAMQACRQAGIRWGLNVLVTKKNWNDLENILALAQQNGSYSVNLLRPKPALLNSGLWLKENLPDEEVNRQLQALIQRWKRRGSFLLTTDASGVFLNRASATALRQNGIVGCTAGRKMLSIDPAGNILPCSHVSLSDRAKGDFMAAWYSSEVLARFRRLEETLLEECQHCDLKASCRGCRAIVLAQGQDFNGTDRSCPKRQSMPSWQN